MGDRKDSYTDRERRDRDNRSRDEPRVKEEQMEERKPGGLEVPRKPGGLERHGGDKSDRGVKREREFDY